MIKLISTFNKFRIKTYRHKQLEQQAQSREDADHARIRALEEGMKEMRAQMQRMAKQQAREDAKDARIRALEEDAKENHARIQALEEDAKETRAWRSANFNF